MAYPQDPYEPRPSDPPPYAAQPHPQPGPEHAQPYGFPAPHLGTVPQPQPAPQYAVTEYGVTEYGAPGYPPPSKSKVLPIVLSSIAAVLMLCTCGAAVNFLVSKHSVDDVHAAAPKVTIAEPQRLGGRAKIEQDKEYASLLKALEETEDELAARPGAKNSFGALYADPTGENTITVLATEATIPNPRKELTAMLAQQGVVTGVAPAETGALGGVAECGFEPDPDGDPDGDVVVCGWADEGSAGMITWISVDDNQARAEFPKLRAEIEKKNS